MKVYSPLLMSACLMMVGCSGDSDPGTAGPNGLVFQLNGDNIATTATDPIELEIASIFNPYSFHSASIVTDDETGEESVFVEFTTKSFIQRSFSARLETLFVNGNADETLTIEMSGTGYDWTISHSSGLTYNSGNFWNWFIESTNFGLDLLAISQTCAADGEVVLSDDITQECLEPIDFVNTRTETVPVGGTTAQLETQHSQVSWPGTDDELQFTWTNQVNFMSSCRSALNSLRSNLENQAEQETIDDSIDLVENHCITRLNRVLVELESTTVEPPPGVGSLTQEWLNDIIALVAEVKVDPTLPIERELFIEQRRAQLQNDSNYYGIYNFPKTGDFTISGTFNFDAPEDPVPAPIVGVIEVTDPGLEVGILRFYQECAIELEGLEEALEAHTESAESADSVESAISAAGVDCSEQIPPMLAYLEFNPYTLPTGSVTLTESWQSEVDELLQQLGDNPLETQEQLDVLAAFRTEIAADEALIQAVIDSLVAE